MPNINASIENMVANCTECQIYHNKLEKETLLQHTVPEKPWTKVATDLFHCLNQNCLILVDYMLRYFEVCQLQNLPVIMGHNIHQESFMNLLKYTTSDT